MNAYFLLHLEEVGDVIKGRGALTRRVLSFEGASPEFRTVDESVRDPADFARMRPEAILPARHL